MALEWRVISFNLLSFLKYKLPKPFRIKKLRVKHAFKTINLGERKKSYKTSLSWKVVMRKVVKNRFFCRFKPALLWRDILILRNLKPAPQHKAHWFQKTSILPGIILEICSDYNVQCLLMFDKYVIRIQPI